MLTPLRWLGTVLAVAVLSGCGLSNVWNEVPARQPEFSAAPTTPEPDERSLHPYTGALAEGAACVKATKPLLADLEVAGIVGGAVTYPVGVAVRSNAKWWTVAVATAVGPNNDGFTRANVERYVFYATNEPSYGADDWDVETFRWQVNGQSDSGRKALACLKKLPIPKPEPKPDDSPAASYTGKLAPGASCTNVSTRLLGKLEQVGQVGGAITYPRGSMVRANKKWWTVAVATKVNPNSDGYTTDNVPATELFVTNAPSYKASTKVAVYYFPIRGHKDKAATKALACLHG